VEENSYASSRSYESAKPAFKQANGSAYANGSWSPSVATPHQVRDLPGGRMLEAAMKEVTTNATEAFRKDLDRSYSFRNSERNLSRSNRSGSNKGLLVVGSGSRTGQIIAEVLGDSRSQVNSLATTAETFRYEAAKAVVENAETIVWVTEETPDVFSPLAPYQEYEGLLNLLACAQQTGNLKKIVFVSSLGVSNVLLPGNLFFGFFFFCTLNTLCSSARQIGTKLRSSHTLFSNPTVRYNVYKVSIISAMDLLGALSRETTSRMALLAARLLRDSATTSAICCRLTKPEKYESSALITMLVGGLSRGMPGRMMV